jgi:predicted pyridoxine 5'-phosphate oxidase superfamily flavin-nucleotide-binding protein
MELDTDVIRLMDESVLCWLATSSAIGQPSVSPKEIFAPFKNNSIIIANIASPGSARNIRENPRACVSFVNVFTQKGYQVFGQAILLRDGDEDYPPVRDALFALSGEAFPFQSAFRVMIEQVKEIIAPRYRLYPETTEQDQIRSAMKTYGIESR